jgi:hypothetical protein
MRISQNCTVLLHPYFALQTFSCQCYDDTYYTTFKWGSQHNYNNNIK